MLSDVLHQYGEAIFEEPQQAALDALIFGTLSPPHAAQFKAFVKKVRSRFGIEAILKGKARWPESPEDRDLLYFLAQSLRGRLSKELPPRNQKLNQEQSQLALRAKDLMKDLARINLEIAQLVVAETQDDDALPGWFLVELVRDLPRLAQKK
jgi:hypothetical protein